MGLCLLQEADEIGLYFAVNVGHVEDIVPYKTERTGIHVCQVKLSFPVKNTRLLALGAPDTLRKLLLDASKIGVRKVEAEILTGRNLKSMPMLLNRPDRIGLVRELRPEEFAKYDVACTVASQVLFNDGTERVIAGRPGTFAFRANAGHKVPFLKVAA